MKTFAYQNDIYTNSEWFLAKITAVCPPIEETCANYGCSWEQLVYCDNLKSLTSQYNGLLNGDCLTGDNVAYPISETEPTVGDIVLMRFRGNVDAIANVYEFVSSSGGSPTPSTSTSCFGVKSVSCSNNFLLVTLADSGGCANLCTTGIAYYQYTEAVEVPTDTNYPLPDHWSLAIGDLEGTGLTYETGSFKNDSGTTLNLRVTLQYYFTPQGTGSAQSRWAYICRNDDTNNIPVASFQASNNTFSAVVATNIFSLNNGDSFTPYAFQNAGAGIFVGDPTAKVKTTIAIERFCT
jgi:hypothetical protein